MHSAQECAQPCCRAGDDPSMVSAGAGARGHWIKPAALHEAGALCALRGRGAKPLPSGHLWCHGCARAPGMAGHCQGEELHPWPAPCREPSSSSAEMPTHPTPALAPFPGDAEEDAEGGRPQV